MKKTRHTPEQRSSACCARHRKSWPPAARSAPQVAKEFGISEATFHRWKARYGGMSSQEAKRLKELEKENARLKKLLAEKELDIDMLKEVSQGNF